MQQLQEIRYMFSKKKKLRFVFTEGGKDLQDIMNKELEYRKSYKCKKCSQTSESEMTVSFKAECLILVNALGHANSFDILETIQIFDDTFNLHSVAYHKKDTALGHYLAYVKYRKQWTKFDDEVVSEQKSVASIKSNYGSPILFVFVKEKNKNLLSEFSLKSQTVIQKFIKKGEIIGKDKEIVETMIKLMNSLIEEI